jgi:alpha-glucosidase
LTDEQPRTLSLPLGFLQAGQRCCAHLYLDGEGANWRSNSYGMRIEKRWVRAGDSLEMAVGASGGAAVRFEAGVEGCGD